MRIYFINRYFYPDLSATSQLLTDISTSLDCSADINVIASKTLHDDSGTVLDANVGFKGVSIHRLRASKFGRKRLWGRAVDYATFHVSVAVYLFRKVKKDDVVVFMTDPPLLLLFNTALVRMKGGLVINWLQDLFPEIAINLKSFPASKLLQSFAVWWRNKALLAADTNVVISEKMKHFLAAQHITNSTVIHNWANGDLIRPKENQENSFRKMWNPDGKFLVGYSGNFGRVHCFKEVMDAIDLLRHESHIGFLFIGDGVGLRRLKAFVSQEMLTNVKFLPYQDRHSLPESLTSIDLHLVTLEKGMEDLVFPSKIYGVLASGRPLAFVGEKGSAIGQLLKSEEIGFSVCHGEGLLLSEHIRSLSCNSNLVQDMGRRARRLYDKKYSSHAQLARWSDLLASQKQKRLASN